METRNI